MKKRPISFGFLILCFVFAQGQQQEIIDSLKKSLPSLKQDSAIVKAYHNIAYYSADVNPAEAIRYAKLAIAAAEKMGWKKALASSHMQWGNGLNNTGDYVHAIEHFDKAYKYYDTIEDKNGMAMALCNIGTAYMRQSNHTESLNYYFKALKLVEEIKDTAQIALYYYNVSGVFMEQKNIEKALAYNVKAHALYEKTGDYAGLGRVYEGRGTISLLSKNHTEAENWYSKALAIYEDQQDVLHQATILTQLGTLEAIDFRKALEYKLKAQAIWDSLAPNHPNAITNTGNLGVAYLDLVRYADSLRAVKRGGIIPTTKNELMAASEKYLRKAIQISTESADIDNKAFFTGVLSELQEQQGKYKDAYLNFRTYYELHDSLYSQESKNKIAAIESEREIELRDKEITLNKQTLVIERKQRLFLIAGIAILLIGGAILWRLMYLRKKTNTTLLLLNNELDEANKVKTKFFGILSHDLRGPVANLINFLHLQQEAPDLVDKDSADRHSLRITKSAENLLDTMESLLLWSKGQMEHFKPQVSQVAVQDLFDDVQKHFSHDAFVDGGSVAIGNDLHAASAVQLRFHNPQGVSLSTDELYIKTILRNLTSNALKAVQHTPGAFIEWKAWTENGQTFLSISDNGPGVSSQQLQALYDDTSAVGTDRGLGLHLVRDMAKAIACVISVESKPGEGTRFRLAI